MFQQRVYTICNIRYRVVSDMQTRAENESSISDAIAESRIKDF